MHKHVTNKQRVGHSTSEITKSKPELCTYQLISAFEIYSDVVMQPNNTIINTGKLLGKLANTV